jgi:membrane fusion protein
MGLFRRQAMETYCDRLHGHVILLPRLPHTALCGFLALWLLLLALFLTQTSYSRKETVLGWLEPESGVVRIYPQSQGKLARLLVENGEAVVSGQALAIINGDRVLPGGEHLETLLLQEFEAQKLALKRLLGGEETLRDARQAELGQRQQTASRGLSAIEAQITIQQQRSSLAHKRQQRHLQLSLKGHITDTEVENLQEQTLLLDRERQTLVADKARQQALLDQLQAELRRLPQAAANNMDQLRVRLSDLAQKIAQLRGKRAHVVLATVDGKVSNINLHAGQRVHFDRPLLSILPAGSKLVAQLLIPVRAAGFLQTGQHLLIRYDAFPYQKFGMQRGRLVTLADSASLPGELQHLPLQLSEAVYRALAEPTSSSISAYGSKFRLKAGMTFSADVELEQRTLLQWLLEPIYSIRGRLT